MSNIIRTRNGLPFDFADGLIIRGISAEDVYGAAALAAQLAAELARDEAIAAKEAAQLAEQGSVAARDVSVFARDKSEDYAQYSVTHASIATTAADAANESAVLAEDSAEIAVTAKDAAIAARDAATLNGGVYATTAEGIAATTVGDYFSVPSELNTEYLVLYLHSAGGVATRIQAYPSVAGLEYSVSNIIHVKENGNDAYTGTSWRTAVATIGRALELAWEIANEALADSREWVTLIEWAPNAVVYLEGHLDLPDNTVIKAAHRTVYVRPLPGFEERNVFRVGSGCFVEGVMFEGWRLNDLVNPSEGFAISFRPGALIRRVPYAHKIAVRSLPTWGLIAPPLDRINGNPLVPRGGGVILADGLVCSQYSIFPNIMAWGATPVTPNGVGYCAKNGGLINAVNAVSMWAHKHFLAIDGGQIILSACSTQFGDYTLHSKGYRNIVIPDESGISLVVDIAASNAIAAAEQAIIEDMWTSLVVNDFTIGWDAEDERYTRSDGALFLRCLRWTLESANEQPMIDFAKGLFNTIGQLAFDPLKLNAFLHSFNTMRIAINALPAVNGATELMITALVNALNNTITNPPLRKEPSRITAIGHTWTAVMSGVALTKIPPARNNATITDSILEENEGVVIASGQDDQGNALFVGGLEINADTGELGGPPFDQAVRRVATRAAISRSF